MKEGFFVTFRHLRIYEAVCRHMSITRAAEELYLSQPSVSLAIAELEKTYRVRLFDRIGKKLYITPAGQDLLGYVRSILGLFASMEQHMYSGTGSRLLRVGASMTVGGCLAPRCAAEFSRRYPGVRVELTVDRTDVIEQKVLANALDIGFIEGLPKAAAQLQLTPFAEDELAAVCRPGSSFLEKTPLTCRELAALPLLLREKGSGTRAVVDSIMDLQEITLTPLWESLSALALIRGAEEELGVAILPLRMVEEPLAQGRLAVLPIRDGQWKRSFYRIQHRNKVLDREAEDWAALMAACAAGESLPAQNREREEI